MSAFMVGDKTINRVVCWFSREVHTSPWFKQKVERGMLLDTSKDGWEAELGKTMFQLNIDGVNSRYGDGEAQKFRPLNYTYNPVYSSKMQVLKSMECWLYQCSEGEVIHALYYRFFDTIVKSYLMASIIRDLPEYDTADWG